MDSTNQKLYITGSINATSTQLFVAPGVYSSITLFDVIIVSPGKNKLGVVKTVKDLTGLGLKESKDLVDTSSQVPTPLKEAISFEEAEAIAKYLCEYGASMRVVSSLDQPDHKRIVHEYKPKPELTFRLNYVSTDGETKTEIIEANTLHEAISALKDFKELNYHIAG